MSNKMFLLIQWNPISFLEKEKFIKHRFEIRINSLNNSSCTDFFFCNNLNLSLWENTVWRIIGFALKVDNKVYRGTKARAAINKPATFSPDALLAPPNGIEYVWFGWECGLISSQASSIYTLIRLKWSSL